MANMEENPKIRIWVGFGTLGLEPCLGESHLMILSHRGNDIFVVMCIQVEK